MSPTRKLNGSSDRDIVRKSPSDLIGKKTSNTIGPSLPKGSAPSIRVNFSPPSAGEGKLCFSRGSKEFLLKGTPPVRCLYSDGQGQTHRGREDREGSDDRDIDWR